MNEEPKIYDARGNGDGVMAPTITCDHNGHINDYMSVLVLALGGTASNSSVTDGTVSPCVLARADTGVVQRSDDTVLVFKERAGRPGGGKGLMTYGNKVFTLSTVQVQSMCYEKQNSRSG